MSIIWKKLRKELRRLEKEELEWILLAFWVAPIIFAAVFVVYMVWHGDILGTYVNQSIK